MWRALAVPVVLLSVCPAFGQDMPLSLILLPEESWQQVPGDFRSIPSLASGPNGDVYIAHHQGRQIDRIDRNSKRHSFARPSDGVHGLAFAPDGRLYACQPSQQRIIALDADGKESVLARDLPAFYLAVTRTGTIYATTPNGNSIYRVNKDGELHCVEGDLRAPLGLTLWADQGTLVVGDMVGRHLTAYRIDKGSGLDAREQYYTLRERPGKPGGVPAMTVDSGGRLYAATEEGVQVFDPTGRMCGVLLRPERQPITALAFGGADLDRLYIACGSQLYVRKLKAKGVAVVPAKSQ